MLSITELVRRAAIIALWVGVYLRVVLGSVVVRGNTPRPGSPARKPWAMETRHIRRYGKRIVAIRLQVVAVAL